MLENGDGVKLPNVVVCREGDSFEKGKRPVHIDNTENGIEIRWLRIHRNARTSIAIDCRNVVNWWDCGEEGWALFRSIVIQTNGVHVVSSVRTMRGERIERERERERERYYVSQADRQTGWLAERTGNGPLSVLLCVINTKEYRVDTTCSLLLLSLFNLLSEKHEHTRVPTRTRSVNKSLREIFFRGEQVTARSDRSSTFLLKPSKSRS